MREREPLPRYYPRTPSFFAVSYNPYHSLTGKEPKATDMKLPWHKSSRSTSPRARKRQGVGRSATIQHSNGDEAEPRVAEMKSGEFYKPQDLEALPNSEIVWNGSDGFDVSPIPSALSLVPSGEPQDGTIEHFTINGFASDHQTKSKVSQDENFILELRELNLRQSGAPIVMSLGRKISKITMNRSETKSLDSSEEWSSRKIPWSMLNQSAMKREDSVESSSSCKVPQSTMNRRVSNSEDSPESYFMRMVSRINRSASKSKGSSGPQFNLNDSKIRSESKSIKSAETIESATSERQRLQAALRDLTTKSTEQDEMQVEEQDKYAVSVADHSSSVRPMSVLTHNLSICISRLDETATSSSFSPDWRAGQEVHLERERLRLEFSKSLTTASNDLTESDRHSPPYRVGCVRCSLHPFHFSCGSHLSPLTPEYEAFWGGLSTDIE